VANNLPPQESTQPGSRLKGAFESLVTVALTIRHGGQAFHLTQIPLLRLKEAAVGVSAPPSLRPPLDTGEALQRWDIAKKGNAPFSISRRDLRQLTWEPTTVYDELFQAVLERHWGDAPLSSRTVQALVRSFHKGWSASVEGQATARWLGRVLRREIRESGVIRKWKKEPAVVLGPDGCRLLAMQIMGESRPVAEAALQWGVDDRTAYFATSILQHAVPLLINPQYQGNWIDKLCADVLPWARKTLPEARFKELMGSVILDKRFAVDGVELNTLKAFVLGAYGPGDPRLPANRSHWTGVPDQARTRVLHWLTKADIVMFFETILPNSRDRHGRKPFWLRYTGSIITSRPILTREDRLRLTRNFRGKEDELQHLGIVGNQISSAFILVFRDVLVVEFATMGRANFYTGALRERMEREMWRSTTFKDSDLRNLAGATESVVHRPGWESNVRTALAQFGVREQY